MGDAGTSMRYRTTSQAAAQLGLTRYTLVRAVRRGELRPALRTPGGRYRFTPEAIAAYGQSLSGEIRPWPDRSVSPQPAAVYEALACGVAVLDAAGRIVYANAAAATLLGLTREQLLGRTSLDPRWEALRADGTAFPGSEHPAMVALRTGQPQRGVTMGLALPSSGRRWLQVDAVPTPDADGLPSVVASFTDISARVEADTLLSSAYGALASGVMVLDSAGCILTANAAAEEILGARLDLLQSPALTRPPWAVQRPNGAPLPPDECPEAIALRTHRPVRGERVRLMRPDGTHRQLQVDAVPLRDTVGTIERVVVSYIDLTVRVQAEEERDRFFFLAQDPMCVADTAGYFVRVNPAFTAMLGWTPQELLARPILDFVHPDDRAATDAEGVRQRSGAPTLKFENRYRHKDGSWRWFSWMATQVVAEGLTYAVARDITEQRRAVEALRASEERYRQVETHAPIGLALVAPDGRWLRVNPALCAIVGYSEPELLARTFQNLTHPDDLDADLALVTRVLAGEIATYQLEKRYLRKDGTPVWILLAVSLVRDAAGMPQYFIAQINDIDARKRAEAALREREAHYRLLTENATDLISRHTPDGAYLYASPACETLLGYTPDDLVQSSAYMRFHPDDASAVRAAHQALHDGDNDTTVVYRIQRKDGRYVWFETRSRAIRAPGTGVLVEIQCASRDISARKEAEEERRASDGRYRQLVELAQEGIWQIDTEQRTTYVNSKMAMLLGYNPAQMVGRFFWAFMDDEGSALAIKTMALFPQGHAEPREYKFVRHDGTALWALLTTAFLYDAADQEIGAFAMVSDITARKREEEQLRHVAQHDALTGLPNRVLFAERVSQALAAAARLAEPLAVLLLDLDRFKWVNDTLGHATGDTLLRAVAERLRATLRAEDTVARLGGDEFAVVLPGTDRDGALVASEKLLSALAAPLRMDGRLVDVGASIGIALSPMHGTDQAGLLRCADVAMYQAKREQLGRALYVAEHDGHTLERLSLTAELRHAIAEGQLALHYQPVLDLASNVVQGLEALVRWPHPTRGLLQPEDFLPLAEETGLSAPLTTWVLEEAVRQCRAWQDEGLEVGVAVNLAGATLRDADLVQRVRMVLEHHALPPTRLTLEITEHAAMVDPERTISLLGDLHEIGLLLALDDLGTGHSSLAHLQRLPIDELKIDRRFVAALEADEGEAATIIAFIQGLGRALKRTVVVKGIEKDTMRQALTALGCDAAQGYAIAPPLPATEVPTWMQRHDERQRTLQSHRRLP